MTLNNSEPPALFHGSTQTNPADVDGPTRGLFDKIQSLKEEATSLLETTTWPGKSAAVAQEFLHSIKNTPNLRNIPDRAAPSSPDLQNDVQKVITVLEAVRGRLENASLEFGAGKKGVSGSIKDTISWGANRSSKILRSCREDVEKAWTPLHHRLTEDSGTNEHPQNEFEIRWVPGHNGIEGNERSDYLAKRGAFMQQHSITSLTHALRRAKEKALEAWREEWRRTPPRGGYAFANRVPPSLEPSQHFKCLAREVYARLIQCRTGHAFIGEYYHRFVPSEDTSCPCGERFQTRAHVIQDCPIFRESRGLLSEVVPDLNLADVFGTKDGIQALGRFLARTNAFKKQPPALLSQSEEVM